MDNLTPVPVVSSLDALKDSLSLESLLQTLPGLPADEIKRMAVNYRSTAADLKKQGGDPADVAGLIRLSELLFQYAASRLDNKGNNGDNEGKREEKGKEVALVSPELVSLRIKEVLSAAGAPPYVIQCSTYVVPGRESVGIIRHFQGEKMSGHRWNLAHLSHCSSVWLCPDCRKYIFVGRCREIARAFSRWTSADSTNNCWMLTLTAQHKKDTAAVDMVLKLKAAYLAFRRDRAFRELWRACPGPLGNAAIIGNWEFTFGPGGTHPHRHLLFFHHGDPSAFSDRLKNAWVRCCASVGLHSVPDAVNFQRIENSAEYVSKIGFELCDSSYHKEAGGGRFNFVGLCLRAAENEAWAKAALRDYIKASRGLRALHWSKNLKKHFEVTDRSDDEIVQEMIVKRVAYISRHSFESAGDDRGMLLVALDSEASGLHPDDSKKACQLLGIDLYDSTGKKIVDCGSDFEDFQHNLRVEIKIEEAKENAQRSVSAGAFDEGSSAGAEGVTAGCGTENGGHVKHRLQLGEGTERSFCGDLQALLFDLPFEPVYVDRGTKKRSRRSDPGTVPGGGRGK